MSRELLQEAFDMASGKLSERKWLSWMERTQAYLATHASAEPFVMVPREPTKEMCRSGWQAFVHTRQTDDNLADWRNCIRAAIAAAPTPAAGAEQVAWRERNKITLQWVYFNGLIKPEELPGRELQPLYAAPTPEVEQDRKDAERYRWLRDESWKHTVWAVRYCVVTDSGKELDSAIDRARLAGEGKR